MNFPICCTKKKCVQLNIHTCTSYNHIVREENFFLNCTLTFPFEFDSVSEFRLYYILLILDSVRKAYRLNDMIGQILGKCTQFCQLFNIYNNTLLYAHSKIGIIFKFIISRPQIQNGLKTDSISTRCLFNIVCEQ